MPFSSTIYNKKKQKWWGNYDKWHWTTAESEQENSVVFKQQLNISKQKAKLLSQITERESEKERERVILNQASNDNEQRSWNRFDLLNNIIINNIIIIAIFSNENSVVLLLYLSIFGYIYRYFSSCTLHLIRNQCLF